jgi:hypothetical protein
MRQYLMRILSSAVILAALSIPALADQVNAERQGSSESGAAQGGDERADCTAGISKIRTALGRNVTETVRAQLEQALAKAEAELKEEEFDECLEAVEDVGTILDQ